MKQESFDLLLEKALQARQKSYCPYSHFSVGAALLAEDGDIYTGANIENASYTPTVCAERVAFFDAVLAGKRAFKAIAVVGGDEGEEPTTLCPPCGVCRQVMSEFCTKDFQIILFDGKQAKIFTLDELFPLRFELKND